jgi:hypothetical protein
MSIVLKLQNFNIFFLSLIKALRLDKKLIEKVLWLKRHYINILRIQEILLLDNLENHEKHVVSINCVRKVFFHLSVDHDWVKSLLKSNQKLVEKNADLQKEQNSTTDKIESLNAKIENYKLFKR